MYDIKTFFLLIVALFSLLKLDLIFSQQNTTKEDLNNTILALNNRSYDNCSKCLNQLKNKVNGKKIESSDLVHSLYYIIHDTLNLKMDIDEIKNDIAPIAKLMELLKISSSKNNDETKILDIVFTFVLEVGILEALMNIPDFPQKRVEKGEIDFKGYMSILSQMFDKKMMKEMQKLNSSIIAKSKFMLVKQYSKMDSTARSRNISAYGISLVDQAISRIF
jgi:hypothetical protein